MVKLELLLQNHIYGLFAVVVVLMTKMKSIRFEKFASCRDVFKTGMMGKEVNWCECEWLSVSVLAL